DLEGYCAAVGRGTLPTMRGVRLGGDDVVRRAAIGRILCHCVLVKGEFESEFGIRFDDYFNPELARLRELERDGLVRLEPDAIRVTPLGRIFLRNVGMVFDRYLSQPKDRPVFSKTL
ncbi:MAG: coproporphyrinogen III oxidase, partial [Acidobacteriota bacterium]|nr:coproporphyrinogen III oxidase [Acidobacteriota bacterium]